MIIDKQRDRIKKNPILMAFLIFCMLITGGIFVSSLENLGTFQAEKALNITQVCYDATYITLTSVSYPNSTIAVGQINMTSLGNGEFNYIFNKTETSGRYDVRGVSNGCENTFATYFEVTPSGDSGSNNQIFFILFFVIAYGVGFFGFFGKNMLISFIGGIAMIFLGIFTTRFGIIVFRSDYTIMLSYITLGIGFIFMLLPVIEYLQEQLN